MAGITPPSSAAPLPKIQRSFTLPAKLSSGGRPRDKGHATAEDTTIEVLFAHPGGRIVSFSPLLNNISTPLSRRGAPENDDIVGILPWKSRTERTMAVGPLRIYRVPSAGSTVAFLNSGSFLHPIMQKSQCWCVDGETIFVIRIRGQNYYRIELPNTCEDDIGAANDLKNTLTQVLQYETTACPFKRGFYVELPEKKETPKKPWKPKHEPVALSLGILQQLSGDEGYMEQSDHEGSIDQVETSRAISDAVMPSPPHEGVAPIISAFEELQTPKSLPTRRLSFPDPSAGANLEADTDHPQTYQQPNTKGSLNRALVEAVSQIMKNDGPEHLVSSPVTANCPSSNKSGQTTSLSALSNGQFFVTVPSEPRLKTQGQSFGKSPFDKDEHSKPMKKGERWTAHRSVTAPVVMLPGDDTSLTASISEERSALEAHKSNDRVSLSRDEVPLQTQGPPVDDLVSANPSTFCVGDSNSHPHKPSPSDATVIPESPISSTLKSPVCLGNDTAYTFSRPENMAPKSPDKVIESSSSTLSSRSSSPSSTLRREFSQRRSHSPLSTTLGPYSPSEPTTKDDIASLFMQKTASIVLVPPAYLVALIIRIARRISNGTIRGESSINAASGGRIPCSWDSDRSDDSDSDQIEDDYGNSLSRGLKDSRQ